LPRAFPLLRGEPIRLEWAATMRAAGRDVHASTHLRRRLMILDPELRRRPRELWRIVVHELFHFVWLRLGNPLRAEWEALLKTERGRGELGWSAEWRKRELTAAAGRRWREYICESFCDTAAWMYSGVARHEEFTLAAKPRARRAAWFRRMVGERPEGLRL